LNAAKLARTLTDAATQELIVAIVAADGFAKPSNRPGCMSVETNKYAAMKTHGATNSEKTKASRKRSK
jgi:hypothetical protein